MTNAINQKQRELTWRAIEQVQQLSALFIKRRGQLAGRVGITVAQWRMLEGIATEHFMPSLFAREQDNTPGAASKITKQLLDKALVKVTISRQDGRQRQYTLTAKGQKVMDQLRGLREQAIAEIWSVLTEGELQAFTGVNDKLLENMRIYLEREE